MEAAQSKKASDRKEAQVEDLLVLDPTHDRRRRVDLEMQQAEAQSEKDVMLCKYNKGLNPPPL